MALRAYLIKKHIVPAQPVSFLIGGDFLLPVNCGSHSDYQNFVVENLRKYYPNPDAISRDTWDFIDRFGNLDLYYTDEMMMSKYIDCHLSTYSYTASIIPLFLS